MNEGALNFYLFLFCQLNYALFVKLSFLSNKLLVYLMEKAMGDIGLPAVTVLVYTSAIMMILRFYAGPIIHRFKPLGLLMISSAIAAVGLLLLSQSTGIMILVVATLYGLGKTFFWPTMLGVVSEQCPKGGVFLLFQIFCLYVQYIFGL